MVATKIFKKCSPHGRLYLYLGQREFISADGLIDDIKGIAYVPELNEIQGILNYLINEGSSLLFTRGFYLSRDFMTFAPYLRLFPPSTFIDFSSFFTPSSFIPSSAGSMIEIRQ